MTVNFLSQIQNLTPQSLEQKVTSLQRKSFAFASLEKISIVAAIAIAGLAIYASIGVAASPFLTAALPVCLIPLGLINQFFSHKKQQSSRELSLYQQISAKMPEVNHSGLAALAAVYLDLGKEAAQRLQDNCAQVDADKAFENRSTFFQVCTQILIPLAIGRHLTLFFADPEIRQKYSFDIEPFGLSFPGLGTCKPKTNAEYFFFESRPELRNDYFFFEDGRPPLTYNELWACCRIQDKGARMAEFKKLFFGSAQNNN